MTYVYIRVLKRRRTNEREREREKKFQVDKVLDDVQISFVFLEFRMIKREKLKKIGLFQSRHGRRQITKQLLVIAAKMRKRRRRRKGTQAEIQIVWEVFFSLSR